MRIALISYAYEPSVGGIETVSALLRRELVSLGHEVRVVTSTPGPEVGGVKRSPRAARLIHELGWADAVVQSHVSLRLSWPLIVRIVRRPWVVVLHTQIDKPGLKGAMLRWLKTVTLPRHSTYAVSEFLASTVRGRRTRVMPNPFDVKTFVPQGERRPQSALLFVGRLVPAKGPDLLLRALARVDRPWTLTMVGDGDLREECERIASELGIRDRVVFEGSQPPEVVAHRMATHSLIVIPSRMQPPEAFGLVALEAIASGCVPLASSHAGLAEAVAGHGILFEPEDIESIASAVESALCQSLERYLLGAHSHLERFSPPRVAQAYLDALGESGRRGTASPVE